MGKLDQSASPLPTDPTPASTPTSVPSRQPGTKARVRRLWDLLNHQVVGGLAVAAILATAGTILGIHAATGGANSSSNSPTRNVYAPPAKCPATQKPMALVQTEYPVANGRLRSTRGLGTVHIDNVIAPDGSANVHKF